jgi:putative FmdB family regulatory protein
MPTYEYLCDKCQHQFEVFQSIMDPPLSVCPKEHCGQAKWGKGKVRRMISAGGGLLFKGSGFYATDYRSENYKSGAKKEASSATANSSSSTSPKSDTKPTTPAKSAPAKT